MAEFNDETRLILETALGAGYLSGGAYEKLLYLHPTVCRARGILLALKIAGRSGLNIEQLIKRVEISKNYVTQILSWLYENGLIEKDYEGRKVTYLLKNN